LSKSTANIGT